MSISTHVIGLSSDDNPEYQKHAKILKVCHEAGVSLPKETGAFFGSNQPELFLLDEAREVELPKTEWEYDTKVGLEIKVSDIPSNVDVIRFYNAY